MGHLEDWQISRVGARSAKDAGAVLKRWIAQYQPDTIISENPDAAMRKAKRQRDILKTFCQIAENEPALNILVVRKKTHKNIYEEAAALIKRHPDIACKLPQKPSIWMPEPRNTIYFEALAMAQQVLSKK